eukprot:ctg_4176.g610
MAAPPATRHTTPRGRPDAHRAATAAERIRCPAARTPDSRSPRAPYYTRRPRWLPAAPARPRRWCPTPRAVPRPTPPAAAWRAM